MQKVFVDGQHGTTGLQIISRLEQRSDIELLSIPLEQRRDQQVRKEYLNAADIVFLCLPDDAAREAVALIENPATKVIDASTAHRTAPGWVYGLPEIGRQRERIAQATRVANPGCYATGFILMMRPLIFSAMLSRDYMATTYAITGYSGGGKSMIADFQQVSGADKENIACRPKNLSLGHKHLPEMTVVSGLRHAPHFLPIVGDFYQGMLVFLPLHKSQLQGGVNNERLHELYSNYYKDQQFVRIMPLDDTSWLDEGGFLSPLACNDTNRVELFVFTNEEQFLVVTRFDNLGKGASGAAVQNMNILLGCEENLSLER